MHRAPQIPGEDAAEEDREILLIGLMKTYATCGETPMLSALLNPEHPSVMSGVTPTGQLARLRWAQALTGVESVIFLRHLQGDFDGKLLVI